MFFCPDFLWVFTKKVTKKKLEKGEKRWLM